MKKIDLTDRVFGKWLVIERVEKSHWKCVCDCGTIKNVYGASMTKGVSTNCGCVKRKHGYEGTKVYRLWAHMKERCFKDTHKSFKDYGGKGVTVCDEWLDPKVFIEWALSNGYEEGLTLDRKDFNGNYEPGNCRFITNIDQQNNKSNNRFVLIGGENKTIAQWARLSGISPKALRHRIEAEWKEEDLLKPVIKYKTRKRGD